MKTKLLVSLIAVLAVMTLSLASVIATTGDLDAEIGFVSIKGLDVYSGSTATIAGFAGEVVPLRVAFMSDVDIGDAKVKAWIGGYREDIASSTRRIHLIAGSIYSESLSLKLPSDIDPEEDYTLYVRIETKTDYIEEEFSLRIQRESYNSQVLSVDSEKTVNAGENLAVDVVLKNSGYEELTDMFVSVTIPELGVSKKAYYNDLTSEDCTNDSEDDSCDKQDSAERTIYVKIPANAQAGVYDMKVEAYNGDTSNVVTRKIVVVGAEDGSKVVVPVTSKQVASGKTETFDIVIVNSGSKVGIYEIVPGTVNGITVTTDKSVVTVPAGSSATVKVSVTGKTEGTYNIAVDVNSEGNPIKKVNLTANVTGKTFTGNLTILTIVLAIVFLVLLVVLIVLLTRKPAKSEELEESYY